MYDGQWLAGGPLSAVVDRYSYLRWQWRLSEVGEWEMGLQDEPGDLRVGQRCELWYRDRPVAAGLVTEKRRGRAGVVILGATAEALAYELGIPAGVAPRGRNKQAAWLPGALVPGDYAVDLLTRPCRVWAWAGDAWSQCTITGGQLDTDGLSVTRTANPLVIVSQVVDTGYAQGLLDHVYVAWRWRSIVVGPVSDTVEVRTGPAPDSLGPWQSLPTKVRWWVTRPTGDLQSGAVVWGYAATGPAPVAVDRYLQLRASFSGGWQDTGQTQLSPVWADAMGLLYAGAAPWGRSLPTGLADVPITEAHGHLTLPDVVRGSLRHAGLAWRVTPGAGQWELLVAPRDSFPTATGGVALIAGENEGLDHVTTARRAETAGMAILACIISPESFSGQPNSPTGMSLARDENMQVAAAEYSPGWPTGGTRSTAIRYDREHIGTGTGLAALQALLRQVAHDSGVTVLRAQLTPDLWAALLPGDLCTVVFPALGRRAQARVVELVWDLSPSRCDVVAGVAVDTDAFLEGVPAGPAALPIAATIAEVV